MDLKNIETANWDDLNNLEKYIRNTDYSIKSHERAITILENHGGDGIVIATIRSEIHDLKRSLEKHIKAHRAGITNLLDV